MEPGSGNGRPFPDVSFPEQFCRNRQWKAADEPPIPEMKARPFGRAF
jgi:hypothetical protein